MSQRPRFRFVCAPSALAGAPHGWAGQMLHNGEVALLASEGLDPIEEVAHALAQTTISVLRTEQTKALQDATVMAYADAMPLVWVADGFSGEVTTWARDRGPMTLLVQAEGPLSDEERRRIDRFVSSLERQSE